MSTISRRGFARLLALSGTASLVPGTAFATRRFEADDFELATTALPRTPGAPDEKFWREVRAKFLLPKDLGFLNAANLCPTSLPVVQALDRNTREFDANPSQSVRTRLTQGREEARKLLAAALRVTPEDIVITRNTSEANNLVSSGLQLGANDEVLLFGDNHPSNMTAWQDKAKRFGFSIATVPQVSPHPGTEYYVAAFRKAFTSNTRVLAITHVSSNSGDVLPVKELCALARAHGVISLVDGAQSFGVLDVDLGDIRPDFYSGSVHKWPCGPKEQGLLFVAKDVQDKLWASVVSLYGGAVGISRKMEANGQRDDAALAALAEALKFQGGIGRDVIERRARELANALIEGLKRLDGFSLWTHSDPTRRAAIVIFKPGTLDPRRLTAALNEKEHIIVTARSGQDRPGLRVSPHFYNTMAEIDRTLDALRKYQKSGV